MTVRVFTWTFIETQVFVVLQRFFQRGLSLIFQQIDSGTLPYLRRFLLKLKEEFLQRSCGGPEMDPSNQISLDFGSKHVLYLAFGA